MERKDNYALQVQLAKQYFLTYDQQKLIKKLNLKHDETYLYTKMLNREYRICRKTGDLEGLVDEQWQDANTHGEFMTLMDLVCDSREDRYTTRRWKKMVSFGKLFHRELMEGRDPFADFVQQNQNAFRRVCEAMHGTPEKIGDISYAIEVFDGLCVCIQFWEEDEDFPPQVTWFWDENALMYLKYETMWFALGLIKKRILEQMKTLTA